MIHTSFDSQHQQTKDSQKSIDKIMLRTSHRQPLQDSALSLHLQTISQKDVSLPRLNLAYNDSNRHNNISFLSRFPKKFVHCITNHSESKVLEESLSILNVLLHQANELTLQEEHAIMHSLSYVKTSENQNQNSITDRLAQEILSLTYRLKSQKDISGFAATLMAEKMNESLTNKYLKELNKEDLKNMLIDDLIKIGSKFKLNLQILIQILDLLYSKALSEQLSSKECLQLSAFIAKRTEENITEESVTFKCLMIYRSLPQSAKLDPDSEKFLNSLLDKDRELFLPLKRQFVKTGSDLANIISYGKMFEIYHVVVMDYLVKNGLSPEWQNYLKANKTQKNSHLRQLCLRIGQDKISAAGLLTQKSLTQADELNYIEMVPIEALRTPEALVQKLQSEPTITNCLFVVNNLCYIPKNPELLLEVHRISLLNKSFNLYQQIEKIIAEQFEADFVIQQMKQTNKVNHKVVLKGQKYFIWLPILVKDPQKMKSVESELATIMNYQSVEVQLKFYVLEHIIISSLKQPCLKFLLFLNRSIEAIHRSSGPQDIVIFEEINFYLKNSKLKNNREILENLTVSLESNLQRTIELIFNKFVEVKSEHLSNVLFELEKWDFYSAGWRHSYRWIMVSLEESQEEDQLKLLDSLQILEMCIENINPNDTPAFVRERFCKFLLKKWNQLETDHMFAVERVMEILWPNQDYPMVRQLPELCPVEELIVKQKKFNQIQEYFFESEHPTSQYLINLTQHHFFGSIDQQNFIDRVLELYDKKNADVRRFTEKNICLLMNFLMWVYQYSEEDMDSRLNDMLLAFLSYKGSGNNQISSFVIRQKCIEIVSMVPHSINLLNLPLNELLKTYLSEPQPMRNLTEIITTIIESRPSFIDTLNLEKYIRSIMIDLITCENLALIEEYLNFLETVCYVEQSKYVKTFQDSIDILYQVLKVERKTVEKYRVELVKFVLDILIHYDYRVDSGLLWFLASKYFQEEKLQLSILELLKTQHFSKNSKVPLAFCHQKILVRLIMQHNINQLLIAIITDILNKSQKQELGQIQFNNKAIKKESSQPPQVLFNQHFQSAKYEECQKLISQIRNPLLISVDPKTIYKFFISKELPKCQNLMKFLFQNPSTRTLTLQSRSLYMRPESFELIMSLKKHFRWNSNIQSTQVEKFDSDKQTIILKKNVTEAIVQQTIDAILAQPHDFRQGLIQILKSCPSKTMEIQRLSFYSIFCRDSKTTQILKEIVFERKLDDNDNHYQIQVPFKLSNLSKLSTQALIVHLMVHIENSCFYSNSPQLEAEQRYIKDVVFALLNGDLSKNRAIVNELFLRLPEKLLTSAEIVSHVWNFAQGYFELLDEKLQKEMTEIDALAFLSALLFCYRNRVQEKSGIYENRISEIRQKFAENNPTISQVCEFIGKNKSVLDSYQSVTKANNTQPPADIQNVTFAKENHEEEGDEKQKVDLQDANDIDEAYEKSKQLKQYTSRLPSQQEKSEDQIKIETPSTSPGTKKNVTETFELTEQSDLVRPKENDFSSGDFYEQKAANEGNFTLEERKQQLQSVRSKHKEQISVGTLKGHSKFIKDVLSYESLTKQELEELIRSIDSIAQTILTHQFYVKKVYELGVTSKLIKICKRQQNLIPESLKEYREILQKKILSLHHSMSFKKEKKSVLFNDQLSINYFKLILSRSLQSRSPRDSNKIIISIVSYCMKSFDSFFRQGLISMLIELINHDLNTEDVLLLLNKAHIDKSLIYEIYHRGTLDKLVEQFRVKNKATSKLLTLWVKLAGKLCLHRPVQAKYLEKDFHVLLWSRSEEITDLQGRRNMTYFYGCMAKSNQTIRQFIVENQIAEKFLSNLQNENCDQLYMLFYNLCSEDPQNIDYCCRIKLHTHLIEKLKETPLKPRTKHFFKCLGQVMSVKFYQQLFFKEKVVEKLIEHFEFKNEPCIYECLLDFVISLETEKEFQELKRQNFWKCLELFDYKLSSEASYAYILQIFLVMIRKGHIKQFNTPEIRGKVTLKAEYSINMEGKELAICVINALSLKTKTCYVTERCVRLLASVIGLKLRYPELELIEDMLSTPGAIDNYEFLAYFYEYDVTMMLATKFKDLEKTYQKALALKILNILGTLTRSNVVIRDKLLVHASIQLSQNKEPPQVLLEMMKTLLVIISFQDNKQHIEDLEIANKLHLIAENVPKIEAKFKSPILNELLAILEAGYQNQNLSLGSITSIVEKMEFMKLDQEFPNIKKFKENIQGTVQQQSSEVLERMQKGCSVRMYKNDGSSSDLILFLTDDQLEINCVIEKGQPVKQKWRLPLNEIKSMDDFTADKATYDSSAFSKSAGIFSSAPERENCLTIKGKSNEFNILFDSEKTRNDWKKFISISIFNSEKVFKNIK